MSPQQASKAIPNDMPGKRPSSITVAVKRALELAEDDQTTSPKRRKSTADELVTIHNKIFKLDTNDFDYIYHKNRQFYDDNWEDLKRSKEEFQIAEEELFKAQNRVTEAKNQVAANEIALKTSQKYLLKLNAVEKTKLAIQARNETQSDIDKLEKDLRCLKNQQKAKAKEANDAADELSGFDLDLLFEQVEENGGPDISVQMQVQAEDIYSADG